MAKTDKIKEFIGWLKVVFGILVASGLSVIGWLATNYQTASFELIVFAFSGLFLIAIGTVVTNKKAMEKINELEDL